MFRRYLQILLLGFVLLFLNACAKTEYSGRSRLMLISESEEQKTGRQAKAEFLSKEPVEENSPRAKFIKQVGARLVAATPSTQNDWAFYYVPKKDFNAYAVIGGTIFVYDGIFDAIKTEGQLATILGHEIAHIVARHSAEKMSKSSISQLGVMTLGVIASVATGSNEVASGVMDLSGMMMQYGLLLPFSREHEYEADNIGTRIMADAGYDPIYAIQTWENMIVEGEKQRGGKQNTDFTSTHPMDASRLQAIKNLYGEVKPAYENSKKAYKEQDRGSRAVPAATVPRK